MANTVPLLCRHCGGLLISIGFKRHYCLVCDNAEDHCYLFRQRQVIIPRNGDEPEGTPKGLPSARVLRRDYEETKIRYKENYQYARSLGIPSITARDFRNKGKEQIEKAAAAMTH